ncbi:MAG: hypothetical protein LBH74_09760 [Nitrososphaerota archaeon]|jgi:hypothetical protein|nr:hypothetical protein [Nitrososphaerota archaeon]
MTESIFFTPEEVGIYNLKSEQMSDEEIIEKTHFNKDVIDEFYRKSRIVARERTFHAFVSKYQRIFELTRDHYGEKDKNRKHVFSIGFSDIDTYLNPRQTEYGAKENIGCIYYLFNSKSPNHKYCILPISAWKILDYVLRKESDTEDFVRFINSDEQLKKFHNCMYELNENNLEVLMRCYKAIDDGTTKGLRKIVEKILQYDKLDEELRQYFLDFQNMLNRNIVEPLENFVNDVNQIKIDKDIFSKALANLKVYKYSAVDKTAIALNIAITCSLTGKKLKFYDADEKKLYYCKADVRTVLNAEYTSAFRMITFNGTHISCCPQFLSLLILLKSGQVKEFGNIELSDKIIRIDEKRGCLARIRSQCYTFQEPQRFTSKRYLDDNEFLSETLEAMHSYLSDLYELKFDIYPHFIEPIKKINLGEDYHDLNINFNSRDSIKTLKPLLEKDKENRYEIIAHDALNAIYENMKEPYKTLYKHAKNKKSLIPKNDDLIKKLDETKQVPNDSKSLFPQLQNSTRKREFSLKNLIFRRRFSS